MKRMFWRSWFPYAVLFCLFVLLAAYTSTTLLIGAIVVACAEILLCDVENNFCFSLFLIPNVRILDDLGVTFLPNILMVLPFLKYLIRIRKISSIVLIAVVSFAVIEFFHSAILNFWQEIIPLICWLLCAAYALSVLVNTKMIMNTSDIFYALAGGVILSSLTFLFANREYLYTLLPSIFAGERFEAYGSDPNYFSLYICVSLGLLFTVPQKKPLHYIMLGFLIAIGFLTASKMCMLMMSFILLYALFTQGLYQNANGKFIRKAMCFLAMGAICLQHYIIQFIHNLLVRAGIAYGYALEWNAITSDRSSIVGNYFHILGTNLLALFFGAGMQYHLFLGETSQAGSHNTYLDIVLTWGIVGIIILIGLWSGVIHYAHLNFKKSLVYYLPLLTLVINFMDLSCFSASMFWFMTVIVLIPFKPSVNR